MTTDTEETTVKRIITIQPESFVDNVWVGKTGELVEGKKLPYPFHTDEDGTVRNQDFWQGDPSRVVGFQDDMNVHRVDLWWADAVKDPNSVVGKFPVMRKKDAGLYTYTLAIESVTVREVPA